MKRKLLLLGIGIGMLLYGILTYAATGDEKEAIRIVCQEGILQAVPQNTDFSLEAQDGTVYNVSLNVREEHFSISVNEKTEIDVWDNKLVGAYCIQHEEKPYLLLYVPLVKGDGIVGIYNLKSGIFYSYSGNILLEEGEAYITRCRRGGICRKETLFSYLEDSMPEELVPDEITSTGETLYLKRPLVAADEVYISAGTEFFTFAAGEQVTFERWKMTEEYEWYFVSCESDGTRKSGWFALNGEKLVLQNANYTEVFSYKEPLSCGVSADTGYREKKSEALRLDNKVLLRDSAIEEWIKELPEFELTEGTHFVIGTIDFARSNMYDIYVIQSQTDDEVYSRLFINVNGILIPIYVEGREDGTIPVSFFEVYQEEVYYYDAYGEYLDYETKVREGYHTDGSSFLEIGGKWYQLVDFNNLVSVEK